LLATVFVSTEPAALFVDDAQAVCWQRHSLSPFVGGRKTLGSPAGLSLMMSARSRFDFGFILDRRRFAVRHADPGADVDVINSRG
jgi:hypothetical protein